MIIFYTMLHLEDFKAAYNIKTHTKKYLHPMHANSQTGLESLCKHLKPQKGKCSWGEGAFRADKKIKAD